MGISATNRRAKQKGKEAYGKRPEIIETTELQQFIKKIKDRRSQAHSKCLKTMEKIP